MRIRYLASFALMALALAGCNDTLDSAAGSIDLSKVKNKVEQPLPDHILADMTKKGMDRTSPIMIRILKEEGVMEIWKAKTDNRFDKIAEYKICAWSGRLGPKVKEGDRQAPEGFYNLTPANLNPNSKYYLAINTGFPNKYDAANGRSGVNLMIHGACSSSGCYSMTDQQVLEIYAFARDAFKGGQKTIQLEAFPFRMTAENMVRHRLSDNIDFWKMLKSGYDDFEVTKRPPEVDVCEKKYVFNQQASGPFNPSGACPAMSTPPALQSALVAYNTTYKADYDKAMSKYSDTAWYDPTEAERKAVVAKQRAGHDLAYAPTGSALAAGKVMKVTELEALMVKQSTLTTTSPTMMAGMPSGIRPVAPGGMRTAKGNIAQLPLTTATISVPTVASATAGNTATAAAAATAVAVTLPANVPVPTENPLAYAQAPVDTAQNPPSDKKAPFWKFWSKGE
jgi:murein L,D-transpeptidase YafK